MPKSSIRARPRWTSNETNNYSVTGASCESQSLYTAAAGTPSLLTTTTIPPIVGATITTPPSSSSPQLLFGRNSNCSSTSRDSDNSTMTNTPRQVSFEDGHSDANVDQCTSNNNKTAMTPTDTTGIARATTDPWSPISPSGSLVDDNENHRNGGRDKLQSASASSSLAPKSTTMINTRKRTLLVRPTTSLSLVDLAKSAAAVEETTAVRDDESEIIIDAGENGNNDDDGHHRTEPRRRNRLDSWDVYDEDRDYHDDDDDDDSYERVEKRRQSKRLCSPKSTACASPSTTTATTTTASFGFTLSETFDDGSSSGSGDNTHSNNHNLPWGHFVDVMPHEEEGGGHQIDPYGRSTFSLGEFDYMTPLSHTSYPRRNLPNGVCSGGGGLAFPLHSMPSSSSSQSTKLFQSRPYNHHYHLYNTTKDVNPFIERDIIRRSSVDGSESSLSPMRTRTVTKPLPSHLHLTSERLSGPSNMQRRRRRRQQQQQRLHRQQQQQQQQGNGSVAMSDDHQLGVGGFHANSTNDTFFGQHTTNQQPFRLEPRRGDHYAVVGDASVVNNEGRQNDDVGDDVAGGFFERRRHESLIGAFSDLGLDRP